MRFVNEPVPVKARIGADGAPQPAAFAWQGNTAAQIKFCANPKSKLGILDKSGARLAQSWP